MVIGTLTYFNSNMLHNCEKGFMRLNLQMRKLKVKRTIIVQYHTVRLKSKCEFVYLILHSLMSDEVVTCNAIDTAFGKE